MQHMHDVNVNCKNHSHLQDVIVGNRLHFTLIKVREKKNQDKLNDFWGKRGVALINHLNLITTKITREFPKMPAMHTSEYRTAITIFVTIPGNASIEHSNSLLRLRLISLELPLSAALSFFHNEVKLSIIFSTFENSFPFTLQQRPSSLLIKTMKL